MKWPAKTLWHLLGIAKRTPPAHKPINKVIRPLTKPSPMRLRYDELVLEMKQTYGLRIRKWRNSSSGCAWIVRYSDGGEAKLIESPYPKGPMSCAIFLHEVGHHAIGFGTYKPRCLEEYYAWKWSLDTMRDKRFNVTEAVQKRMDESIKYAVKKAQRRGLKNLPPQLLPYVKA
ncbi:MAG: hypothetical protein IH984_11810 [Planctomycetes bacterium]|nr:hypothetical protein [Planctomycetota bacterium]